MTRYKITFLVFFAACLSACGGSSGPAPTPPPPAPVTSTYSATLTDIVIVRSADSLEIDTAGVTVDGATVTITE